MTTEHRLKTKSSAPVIHPEGLYQWADFEDRIPFSRETWRKRIIAKAAPRPKIISHNMTAWQGADVLAWLQNPTGYRDPVHSKDET